MLKAKIAKLRSNCLSRHIGAVIVKDNRQIATGYNGTPSGIKNCFEGGCPRCTARMNGEIKTGENLERCLCTHAEANAIMQCALFGNAGSTKGATMYVWAYYNVYVCNKCNRIDSKTNKEGKTIKKRIASLENADDVWSCLSCSETYRLSGKRYFNEWRWYPLDYKTIVDFARHSKLLISENKDSLIEGVAIINTTGYIDKNDVFQIVYLDATSTSTLEHLVSYCADMCASWIPYDNKTDCRSRKQLQIISYQTSELSKSMCSFKIKESAQFFLYSLSL